jgi:hypothetical protein
VLRAALDVATPGPSTAGVPRAGAGSHPGGGRVDAITRQERRLAAVKASAELVEVCVRIVVTGPDRSRCRQHAWRAANAFRGVVTAQATDTVRIPDAGRRVRGRAIGNGPRIGLRGPRPGHGRGWFVATDTEVGSLARLPHNPALHRFVVAGAPHLPAPLGIPRLGAPGEPGAGAEPDGEVA